MIEVNNALKKLKEAVEEDQLSSDYVPQDCCVDREYQENIRFRTKVRILKTFDTNHSLIRITINSLHIENVGIVKPTILSLLICPHI